MNRSQRRILVSMAVFGLGLSACHAPRAAGAESTASPSTDAPGESTGIAQVDAGPVGAWGEPDNARHEPFLELMADGRLAGSDGCNRIMGTWKALDPGVEITLSASTMMACEGVDTWLRGARTAQIEDTTLIIQGGDGEELGRLSRTR